MDYKEYNDYELVNLAQELNEDAMTIIYEKYKPVIYKKCRKYINFIKGIELCDLVQECYIVLDSAIKTFNQDKDNIFYTYLNVCLDRHLASQYRKSINGRNRILNESISLDVPLEDDDNSLIDIIEDNCDNPELELNTFENSKELYNKIISKLTALEECVFILKIQNFDYKEIAAILDKDSKSIDNAIQRIKTKISNMEFI